MIKKIKLLLRDIELENTISNLKARIDVLEKDKIINDFIDEYPNKYNKKDFVKEYGICTHVEIALTSLTSLNFCKPCGYYYKGYSIDRIYHFDHNGIKIELKNN